MVSIIIPVYNVEEYLDECIQSVLRQTYQDFEVILVDDGSKDNSLCICRRYASNDSRVKIFSIDNSGANAARKVGVENAVGEYIMFIDSDDTICHDALGKLLDIVNNNGSDVDIVLAHMPDSNRTVNADQFLIDLLSSACGVTMYSKIYRAKVLKKYFVDIPRCFMYGEDLLQNVNLARYVIEVVYSDVEYYNYRIVESSVSHTIRFSYEYEKKYHNFMKSLLQKSLIENDLQGVPASIILISWYKCKLNGLKNVVLYSNIFDFRDADFIQLKRELRPYMLQLSFDDKIMLYSNQWLCKKILKSYRYYCILKNKVKIGLHYLGIKK